MDTTASLPLNQTSNTLESPPLRPPSLDYHMFPHIIARLVQYAPIDALFHLRATCRSLRQLVDSKRLGLHIVVEHSRVYTRYGNISLHDRPELVQYMRVLDIKQFQVHENKNESATEAPWVAGLITVIQDIAHEANNAGCELSTLDIDLIRVLVPHDLPLLDSPPQVEFVRAKRTVYLVEMDASHGYAETHVHLAPIAGSHEAIVNLRYDPNHPGIRYGNVFQASHPPKSTVLMFSTYSGPAPVQDHMGSSPSPTDPPQLAIEVAQALAAGIVWGPPDAHLTVVGVDDWPTEWFRLIGREMRDGDQEWVFRSYFEGHYDGFMVKKLGSNYDFSETESEIEAEMAFKLRFVSLSEYEEAWSSLHPDGISILLRP